MATDLITTERLMIWNSDHMNGWGYGLMGVGSLLFWTVLILVGIAVTRHLKQDPSKSPERILAERYARGDIDDEQYARRRAALSAHDQTLTGS